VGSEGRVRSRRRGALGGGGAPRVARAGLLLPLLALACGADAVVTLGAGGPSLAFGDGGQRIRYINEESSEEFDATLTRDLLEIYFISDREGGVGVKDVWYALRRSRMDPFDAPVLLVEASSPLEEASPAISPDGLTLWVGSRREGGQGGMDIWQISRPSRGEPWSEATSVAELNSPADDLPRPLGQDETLMPLASDRDGTQYQTYLARRAGPGAPFESIEPLSYLWEAGSSMEDAFLTEDGLLLFYKRAPLGQPGDVYLAWRASTDRQFRDPVALDAVNSPADDRDPFLSADRIRFFFASSRRDDLALDIYATTVELPEFD
jgi:hypothetical protein